MPPLAQVWVPVVVVPGLLPGEMIWLVPMVRPERLPPQLVPLSFPWVKARGAERFVEEL